MGSASLVVDTAKPRPGNDHGKWPHLDHAHCCRESGDMTGLRHRSRYECAIAWSRCCVQAPGMHRRTLAGLLWFFVAWYAWSFVVAAVGVPELIGPVLGILAAALIVGDPLDRIWHQGEARVTPERFAVSEPA